MTADMYMRCRACPGLYNELKIYQRKISRQNKKNPPSREVKIIYHGLLHFVACFLKMLYISPWFFHIRIKVKVEEGSSHNNLRMGWLHELAGGGNDFSTRKWRRGQNLNAHLEEGGGQNLSA